MQLAIIFRRADGSSYVEYMSPSLIPNTEPELDLVPWLEPQDTTPEIIELEKIDKNIKERKYDYQTNIHR